MRVPFLLLLLLTSCTRPSGGVPQPVRDRAARLLASLIETADKSARAGLDSGRARAAADSVLKGESVTGEEFLSDVRAINRDVTLWRAVSEEAARILEQHLAAKSAGVNVPPP
jgi:hypothetical protein